MGMQLINVSKNDLMFCLRRFVKNGTCQRVVWDGMPPYFDEKFESARLPKRQRISLKLNGVQPVNDRIPKSNIE
jgi:hypothetical protein